jgi:hypothetical protein
MPERLALHLHRAIYSSRLHSASPSRPLKPGQKGPSLCTSRWSGGKLPILTLPDASPMSNQVSKASREEDHSSQPFGRKCCKNKF